MNITRTDSVQATESPGGNSSVALATPRLGATDVSVIRQRQAAGGTGPLHHHDREEVIALRSGSLRVTVGDETADIHAGDTLIIPANTLHQLVNSGDEPAEWLLIAARGVRFFGADGVENQPEWAR